MYVIWAQNGFLDVGSVPQNIAMQIGLAKTSNQPNPLDVLKVENIKSKDLLYLEKELQEILDDFSVNVLEASITSIHGSNVFPIPIFHSRSAIKTIPFADYLLDLRPSIIPFLLSSLF
jgi:hypothetical protein